MEAVKGRMLVRATIVALLVAVGLGAAGAADAAGPEPRIAGGTTTSIKKWPWQVAFLISKERAPGKKPSERFFCGGSLIAPTIVVTATHCALEIDLSKPEYFSVVGGRTNLNKVSEGSEVVVKDAVFPLTRSGVPRYLLYDLRWDVSILELTKPLDQPPIKIAGPDEKSLIRPGSTAWKTGWGRHDEDGEGPISLKLRKSKTAIQPPKACADEQGDDLFLSFDPDSQVCIGDPDSDSSGCYGDSGGPSVVRSDDGYRLFGATSYGIGYACDPDDLSVDAALAQDDVREWIQGVTIARSGVDPVGSGGKGEPLPDYCRVPDISGDKLQKAKNKLRRANCHVGKVRRVVFFHGRRSRNRDNTVVDAGFTPYRLQKAGFKVDIVLGQWTLRHHRNE